MLCGNISRARAPDKVTESMDQALAEIGIEAAAKAQFVSSAALRRLERVEW
jgi:hypothetical protein